MSDVNIQALATPIFDPGGRAILKTVSYVKIIQSEFLHDVAIITLRGEDMSAPELQPGTPVLMTYGWQNMQSATFYGYIDHAESSFHRMVTQGLHYEDVTCLGVSYILKDPFLGSWTSVKASDLVQGIANQYLLSTLLEVDDTVWPQLSSTGISAWSFLVNMAQKLGYTLACNQTLIRFTSVDLALAQAWSTMPIFRSIKSAPNINYQTLAQFEATQGETLNISGHTRAIRQAGGIDLRTGQVITLSDDASSVSTIGSTVPYPFFAQNLSDLVINDQFQGQASLTGLQQQNRFHYQAQATLSGDATVVQGMPIVLTGLDTKDNGMWWVHEVTHNIQRSSYTMDVRLGRDSSGDSGLRPTTSSDVAFSTNNVFAFAMANIPATRLVNNRWRSAFQANTLVVSS